MGFWPGGLSASLVNGSWTLGHRTMSHPRGLTGCEYLASYELSAIMGFDLCNPKVVTSIRTICPVSCGCRTGMAECPAACTQVNGQDTESLTNVTPDLNIAPDTGVVDGSNSGEVDPSTTRM